MGQTEMLTEPSGYVMVTLLGELSLTSSPTSQNWEISRLKIIQKVFFYSEYVDDFLLRMTQ